MLGGSQPDARIHFVHFANAHPMCDHGVKATRGLEAPRGGSALQDKTDVDPRRGCRLDQAELFPGPTAGSRRLFGTQTKVGAERFRCLDEAPRRSGGRGGFGPGILRPRPGRSRPGAGASAAASVARKATWLAYS